MRVEKLEGATRGSSIVEEVPSTGVGMKVDDTPSKGDGKVIERNQSKERKIRIMKARVEYRIEYASIAIREVIFNTVATS